MAVVHDATVVEAIVGGEDLLNCAQARTDDGMVQEDSPGVVPHGSAFSHGDVRGFHGGEPVQDLLNAYPRYRQDSEDNDDPADQHMLGANLVDQQQKSEKHQLNTETDDSSSGSRKNQRHDRNDSEQAHENKSLPADLAQYQRNKRQGNQQFRKSRKMVSIYVRPKRNASIPHFSKPIEFPVEGQVLEDPEKGDEETKAHQKPDELSPLAASVKHLIQQVNHNQVSDE